MKLLNLKGREIGMNVTPYRIDWDGKSLSQAQFRTKQFLKKYWAGHIVYEEFPVFGTRLKVDILNMTLRLAIEVHGPQHEQFHYFHNNSRFSFLKGMKNDGQKEKWLELNKFRLWIIYDHETKTLSEEFFNEKFGGLY